MLKVILLIFLSCLTFNAVATEDIFNLGSRHFDTIADPRSKTGMVITYLTSDKEGFLWIGTAEGLFRFDGYQFKKFTHDFNDPESLSGNFIRSLWAAEDGKLWVGTISGGVSVFDPNTEKFARFLHNPDNSNSISHNRVEAILGDNQGGVWLGTNAGLDYLDLHTQKIKHYRAESKEFPGLNDNQIRALLYDKDGALWIGSWSGLNRLTKDMQSFESVHSAASQANSLHGQKVSALVQADNGKIWIGTVDDGAAWIEPDGRFGKIHADPSNPQQLSHPWVVGIIQANETEIWMGTYGGGINVIDAKSNRVVEKIRHDDEQDNSINFDNLGDIYQDDSGLIWVGTWGEGLNRHNPANSAFRTIRKNSNPALSLEALDSPSIAVMKNHEIWIGSSFSGIAVLSPEKGLTQFIQHDDNDISSLGQGSITAINQAEDGSVWIGTQQSGLNHYAPETKAFTHYGKNNGLVHLSISSLLLESDVKIWAGTQGGLFLFNAKDKSFQHLATIDNPTLPLTERILALAQQKNGTLWVGTDNGLYYLLASEQYLSPVVADSTRQYKLINENIQALYVDTNDQLWISTARGLVKFLGFDKKEPMFKSITIDPTSSTLVPIASLIEDGQGRFWDFKGFYDTNSQLWQTIDHSDGATIEPWTGSHGRTTDNTLLFGGARGLLMIKPERFKKWRFNPPLVITEVKLNGAKLENRKFSQLQLAPDIKSFSIEFAALDYSDPQLNRYAYQLAGYDTDWTETDSQYRIASYTNIDPGKYQLNIRGTNRLGEWSNQQISLPIEILPAWFQTSWFKTLVLILVLSILYLIYLARVKTLHARRLELSLEIKARSAELMILGKIGRELNSLKNEADIFNKLHEHISGIVDSHVFAIGMLNAESSEIEFHHAYENGIKLPDYVLPLSLKNNSAVWCINNKQELFVKRRKNLDKYYSQVTSAIIGQSMESIMYFPLFARENQIIGCMTVQSPTVKAYSIEQRDIIRTLAAYTSIAIDNAVAYAKLTEISTTDQLTGLKNRRFLIDQLDNDIAKTIRDYENSALKNDKQLLTEADLIFYLLDLDHFKQVNDKFGHAAGDAVLIQVREILEKVFRTSDYMIRWGGEEFLVVARFSDRNKASCLAERLRTTIETHPFKIDAGQIIRMTGSIGFSSYPFKVTQPHETTWLQIIDIADKCLYAAKKTSRNAWIGVEVTELGQTKEILERFKLDPQDLLDKKEIALFTSIAKSQSLIWE